MQTQGPLVHLATLLLLIPFKAHRYTDGLETVRCHRTGGPHCSGDGSAMRHEKARPAKAKAEDRVPSGPIRACALGGALTRSQGGA